MTTVKTRLVGARELDALLRKLPREIAGKQLDGAVRAGARVVRDAARETVPVRAGGGAKKLSKRSGKARLPGFGRASIGLRKDKGTEFSTTILVTVGSAFYLMFAEFGTRFQPSRPWLRPAFERSKSSALDKIGGTLGRNVERAAKKLAGKFAKSGLAKSKFARRKR